MPCNSITALPLACSDGTLGGLGSGKIYMIAYKDLKAISTATTEVYSANSTTNIVSTVGLQSGKTFTQVGILKNTAGVKETLTKDSTKGTCFFTQEFTLVVGGLSNENRTFVETVKNQPVSIIYKTRANNFFVIGLSGDLEVSAIEGGSGTAQEDLIGYTLTFQGVSSTLAPLIDSTLVASITS